jgi:hypothetical protein
MRILFDHNVPSGLRHHLAGHEIKTTRQMRWDRLQNGELLREAAGAAFGVLLSIDKKLRHEQNLMRLPLPVVILDSVSNALPVVMLFAPFVLKLLESPLQNALYIISSDGSTACMGSSSPP